MAYEVLPELLDAFIRGLTRGREIRRERDWQEEERRRERQKWGWEEEDRATKARREEAELGQILAETDWWKKRPVAPGRASGAAPAFTPPPTYNYPSPYESAGGFRSGVQPSLFNVRPEILTERLHFPEFRGREAPTPPVAPPVPAPQPLSRTDKEQMRGAILTQLNKMYATTKGNRARYDQMQGITQKTRQALTYADQALGYPPHPTFYVPAFEAGKASAPPSGRTGGGGRGAAPVRSGGGMTFKRLTPTVQGKLTAAGITPAVFDADPIGSMKRIPVAREKREDVSKGTITGDQFSLLNELGWPRWYLKYGEPATARDRTKWYVKQGWVDENWAPIASYEKKIEADIAAYTRRRPAPKRKPVTAAEKAGGGRPSLGEINAKARAAGLTAAETAALRKQNGY